MALRRARVLTASAGRDRSPETKRRALGFPSLLALGVNGIVGVGIFFAPRTVGALAPGMAGLGVYLGVVLACLPVAMVFATLGARFDEDGGPYVYAREAFGTQAAFGVGWVAYVSAVLSTSTVVVGLVEALAGPFGLATHDSRAAVAALLVTALALVLGLGLRISAWVWSVVTIGKLVPLVALIVASVVVAAPKVAPLPVTPAGGGTLAAALAVLFAIQGFEIVPLPAAQVRGSSRAVPLATVGALLLAGGLYLLLHAACVRALPDLGSHAMPLADAARVYGGERLYSVVLWGTSVSSFGIVVGMIAMTPRYLAALGRGDGLGPSIGALSARAVPVRAFVVTWAAVLFVVVLSLYRGSIASLFALSSVSVIVQYAVTSGSLAALALRRRSGLEPRHAWPVPFALAACVLIAMGAKSREILVVVGVIALGFAVRGARRGSVAGAEKPVVP